MNVLVLNAGSSSLKYKLFEMGSPGPSGASEKVLAEGSGAHARGETVVAAVEAALTQCRGRRIDAVGHRVVYGGARYSEPTRVTPALIEGLRGLEELDPLHNPTEVAMIEAALRILPDAPGVAVFDTAFHRTIPEVAWRYAIPTELADRMGLRRYGFHGLSYEYVSGVLIERLGSSSAGRLILCHLGNGASVCAVRDGRSVDTSMGLTPLEGLLMGTRSGDVDPGLLLYLIRHTEMTVEEAEELLNHRSGLLGLSGSSSDVRLLEAAAAAGDARAELALEIFAYRVARYVGAYAAVLEGVDALAFTGGIGQHSVSVRQRVCRRLAFLGLELDEQRNLSVGTAACVVSTPKSPASIWMVPTEEERQIARATAALL